MKLNYILCLSGFLSLGLLSAQAQDYTGMKIQRYRHWAKGQISLVPLEIGQITPEGWLRQWGEDAAKGITGHLDEYQPVYGNGWKGYGFKARGANETDGTGWPIEQCSYWLDGATKLAYILGDRALQKKVSDRLNIVVDGVLKGAGTFIWWKTTPSSLTGSIIGGMELWGERWSVITRRPTSHESLKPSTKYIPVTQCFRRPIRKDSKADWCVARRMLMP